MLLDSPYKLNAFPSNSSNKGDSSKLIFCAIKSKLKNSAVSPHRFLFFNNKLINLSSIPEIKCHGIEIGASFVLFSACQVLFLEWSIGLIWAKEVLVLKRSAIKFKY